MAGKLEVAPFGADLGAEHDLGAGLFLGEVGGSLVPFEQRHLFVEYGTADPLTGTQGILQGQRRGCFRADHQHLVMAG